MHGLRLHPYPELIERVLAKSPRVIQAVGRTLVGEGDLIPPVAQTLALARSVAANVDFQRTEYVRAQSRNCISGRTISTLPYDEDELPEQAVNASDEAVRNPRPGALLILRGKTYGTVGPHLDRDEYKCVFGVFPLTDGRRLVQLDYVDFPFIPYDSHEQRSAQVAMNELFPDLADREPLLALRMCRVNVGYLDQQGAFLPHSRAVNPLAFGGNWITMLHELSCETAPPTDFNIEDGKVTILDARAE